VNIHRNYGTVNVYVNGPRRYRRPHRRRIRGIEEDIYPRRPDVDRPRDVRPWPMPDEAESPEQRLPVGCGGYPCDPDCGPSCWVGRFRQGYCGHGCDAYRRRVRIESEDRTIRVPRYVVDDRGRPRDDVDDPAWLYPEAAPAAAVPAPPPPAVRTAEPYRAPPPPEEDRSDRRRYEGPRYPR
jgi:hypothetical protein